MRGERAGSLSEEGKGNSGDLFQIQGGLGFVQLLWRPVEYLKAGTYAPLPLCVHRTVHPGLGFRHTGLSGQRTGKWCK